MNKKYRIKEAFIGNHFQIDYERDLNANQLEIVKGGKGASLILAGAGSGKTRTLVYRVAYLIENGINPENILLVTFTNKAANEMLKRVEFLIKGKPNGLWGGTFHHIGNKILRKFGTAIKINPDFNILDRDDSIKIIKDLIKKENSGGDKKLPKPSLVHSIISLSSNNQTETTKIIENNFSYFKKDTGEFIEKIKNNYNLFKKTTNNLDFDDLLLKWLELLQNSENTRNFLSNNFKYILVDEYQDTNTIQDSIISLLAEKNGNIMVVGDDSQGIYSFRGADINNILEFPKRYSNAKIYKLIYNYRSCPEILNLANISIKKNKKQYFKNLKAVREKNKKPILVPTADSYQQAKFLAQRIIELQSDGRSLKETAILFRAAYQIIELEIELNKRGIPYQVRGGMRFFEQAHIKDLISFLKILNNYKDKLSWLRVMEMYEGIGPATSNKLYNAIISRYSSLNQYLDSYKQNKIDYFGVQYLKKLTVILEKLILINSMDVSALIQTVLKEFYADYAVNSFDNAKERLDDLKQLQFFSSSFKNLALFLSDVSLSESFKSEVSPETVNNKKDILTLTTIHQAKGLEWNSVFLIGLIEGQFPNSKVYQKPDELEEERRLFYVACTRAMDNLYLTYPIISQSYMTGPNINRTSRFIEELPEDAYDRWMIESDQDNNEKFQYAGKGVLDKIIKVNKKRKLNDEIEYIKDYE